MQSVVDLSWRLIPAAFVTIQVATRCRERCRTMALEQTSAAALAQETECNPPPTISPVKRHPCAHTQPPRPFRETVSVKLHLARPYRTGTRRSSQERFVCHHRSGSELV